MQLSTLRASFDLWPQNLKAIIANNSLLLQLSNSIQLLSKVEIYMRSSRNNPHCVPRHVIYYYFTVFIFCKFSYLYQFYSFILTILSYQKFLSSFPLYLYRKQFFWYSFNFCKFSLDQFHSNSFKSFFNRMFIDHTYTFIKFLPLYF